MRFSAIPMNDESIYIFFSIFFRNIAIHVYYSTFDICLSLNTSVVRARIKIHILISECQLRIWSGDPPSIIFATVRLLFGSSIVNPTLGPFTPLSARLFLILFCTETFLFTGMLFSTFSDLKIQVFSCRVEKAESFQTGVVCFIVSEKLITLACRYSFWGS